MRYKIWNSAEAWLVQEDTKGAPIHVCPTVFINVHCESKKGGPGETPKAWLECSGYMIRHGSTNAIEIRP
jgi:hypothetical protein